MSRYAARTYRLLAALYQPHVNAMVKGADISWMTQMEAAGYRFYNNAGTKQDLLPILKDHGLNAVRLRVWVNPANGWNNIKDVITKAKRAKAYGFDILIDFHYSDSWADPGHQTKPAAWRSASFNTLMLQRLALHLRRALRPEAGRNHAQVGTGGQRNQQRHAVARRQGLQQHA